MRIIELAHIGRNGQPPLAPLTLIGDFGGGGLSGPEPPVTVNSVTITETG